MTANPENDTPLTFAAFNRAIRQHRTPDVGRWFMAEYGATKVRDISAPQDASVAGAINARFPDTGA